MSDGRFTKYVLNIDSAAAAGGDCDGGGGGAPDVAAAVDVQTSRIDGENPGSSGNNQAVTNLTSAVTSVLSHTNALDIQIDGAAGTATDIDAAIAHVSGNLAVRISNMAKIRENWIDGKSTGFENFTEGNSTLGDGLDLWTSQIVNASEYIFDNAGGIGGVTLQNINTYLTASNIRLDGLVSAKTYPNSGSLQSSKPASSHSGSYALVGSPKNLYSSNGSAWVQSSQDLGAYNVWAGSSIPIAINSASSNIKTGDYALVNNELFYLYAGGETVGTHAMPVSIPAASSFSRFDNINVYGAFYGVDPVDEGLDNWAYANSGTPSISVSGSNLILHANTSADRAFIGLQKLRPTGPMIMVVTDISGTASNVIASRGPQIQIRTANSDRVITMRPDSSDPTDPTSSWEIDSSTTDTLVNGTQIGTKTDRIEIYFDPSQATSPIRVRAGGPGSEWQAFDYPLNSFSSSFSVILDSGRLADNQTLSVSGIFVAQLS